MGIFSKLFGSSRGVAEAATAAPTAQPSLIEETKRQIEMTEGELHDAEDQAVATTDPTIKNSLQLLVARKTQAISDLKEKLKQLEQNSK